MFNEIFITNIATFISYYKKRETSLNQIAGENDYFTDFKIESFL